MIRFFTIAVCIFIAFSAKATQVNQGLLRGSDLGSFGDLNYKRSAEGVILKKLTDEEILQIVTDTLSERLAPSGVIPQQIKITKTHITFDLHNQNGDIIHPYEIERSTGLTHDELQKQAQANEKLKQEAETKKWQDERLQKMQDIAKNLTEKNASKKATP